MKRSAFFASLFAAFGVCAAQEPEQITVVAVRQRENGECPVCRTMAAPFHRPTQSVSLGCTTFTGTCEVRNSRYGPTERITRCVRCNAAFWQDAEKE